MSEQLGRLQLLLERVQSRAAGPRVARAAYAARASAAPAPVDLEEEALVSAAPETPMHAPEPIAAAAYPSEAPGADSEDAEVEVSSEVVEVDIDIEEAEAIESGAQLVAQQTIPPDDLEEEEEQPATHVTVDVPEHEEEVAAAAMANEIQEPTPSSSRRPIAAEEAAAEAYDEGSGPRHTPPPESGRQIAAAPSNTPAPRISSAAPPSLEGHTLIGGWREPGLGTPKTMPASGTGGARLPTLESTSDRPAAAAEAGASGTRLSPDVTEPKLGAATGVASFSGAPQAPAPTTLGELLDLSLAL